MESPCDMDFVHVLVAEAGIRTGAVHTRRVHVCAQRFMQVRRSRMRASPRLDLHRQCHRRPRSRS